MTDKISFASPEDAPAILAHEEECFSMPHTLSQIEHELDDGIHHYLCAYENGSLTGYVSYSLIADEIYIGNVAVEPEFRRQGIGSALIDELISQAEGCGAVFITLEVRDGNAPARALYESKGFHYIAYLKDYYSAPKEDAVIMTLFFPRSKN